MKQSDLTLKDLIVIGLVSIYFISIIYLLLNRKMRKGFFEGVILTSGSIIHALTSFVPRVSDVLVSAGVDKIYEKEGAPKTEAKSVQQRVTEILNREENLIFLTCLGRSSQHRRSAYGILLVCLVILSLGIWLLYKAMISFNVKDSFDWHYVLTSGIPRIGMILLLIYSVQILLRLYRYHLKMSDFYSSRYDAMLLSERLKNTAKIDADLYSRSLGMVSAPYDVGKEVRAPWDDVFSKAQATKKLQD